MTLFGRFVNQIYHTIGSYQVNLEIFTHRDILMLDKMIYYAQKKVIDRLNKEEEERDKKSRPGQGMVLAEAKD